MAYLPSFRFSAVLVSGIALLFSGCCANNVCDYDDSQADAIRLVFTKSFTAADLDTLVVQRYPLTLTAANLKTTKPETVTLIRTTTPVRDSVLVINNTTPFPQSNTSTKLDQYKYVVRYYAAPRRVQPRSALALIIDNVTLKGDFSGNGCCTYYLNTQKIVTSRKDSATATAPRISDLTGAASVLTIDK